MTNLLHPGAGITQIQPPLYQYKCYDSLCVCEWVIYFHITLLARFQLCTSQLRSRGDEFFPNKLFNKMFTFAMETAARLWRHSRSFPALCNVLQAFLKKKNAMCGGALDYLWCVCVWALQTQFSVSDQISTCCWSLQAEQAGLTQFDWCPSAWHPLMASSFPVCSGSDSDLWTSPGRHTNTHISILWAVELDSKHAFYS